VIDLTYSPMAPHQQREPLFTSQHRSTVSMAQPHFGVPGFVSAAPLVQPFRGGGDFPGVSKMRDEEQRTNERFIRVETVGNSCMGMHQRIPSGGGGSLDERISVYGDRYADFSRRMTASRGVRPDEPIVISPMKVPVPYESVQAPHPEVPTTGWVQFGSSYKSARVR